MTNAVSRLLTEFGVDKASGRAGASGGAGSQSAPQDNALPIGQAPLDEIWHPSQKIDYSVVKSAYEAGAAEARLECQALVDRARLEEAQAGEQRLQRARQQWLDDSLEPVIEALSQKVAALNETIETHVAEILTPFVQEEVKQRALRSLLDCVADVLKGRSGSSIIVTAPHELVEELEPRLAPLGAIVDVQPSPGGDVEVRLDDTIVRTQIGRWQEMMQGAIE